MRVASGQIAMWEGGSLWLFEVPELPPAFDRVAMHAHHALQLTLSLGGSFKLHLADRVVSDPVALVAADAEHAFEARGTIALLFIEPESRAGRALSAKFLQADPAVSLPPGIVGDAPAKMADAFRRGDKAALRVLGQELRDRVSKVGDAQDPDVRVRDMIGWAYTQIDRPISIGEAARQVGLSPGRASHLFVEQTGLAFRTYLLWLRLIRAGEAYASGQSLTDAAHGAGFADSAHFSRTFKRMFGLTAASLDLT